MSVDDVTAVMIVNTLAFTVPWKASGYEYEITANTLAHYQVLLWLGDEKPCLVGYVGHWLMAGEAHISTLAVHPQWQGLGLGETLLLTALLLATQQGAQLGTLEVRRSNVVAQRLYAKYRFTHVGVRLRYYKDNREDALILTSEPFDAAYTRLLYERGAAVSQKMALLRPEGRPCVQLGNEPATQPANTV